MNELMTVVFMPRRYAPKQFKQAQYVVSASDYKIAERKALAVFVKEHDYKYYKDIVITPTHIIE